jgi:hypothetical protein
MTRPITIESTIHFRRSGAGSRKKICRDAAPDAPQLPGRVPRVSRLMALAIRFDCLIRDGKVHRQSELAFLTHVTPPRMTQIMNLLHLAPDIQEDLLFLSRLTKGRDAINEKRLRPIAAEVCWSRQRDMWTSLRRNLR